MSAEVGTPTTGSMAPAPEQTAPPKKKRRCNAAKKWCFTWHEPYNVDELVEKFTREDLTYIFAEEVGDEGKTPHLQGFIESEFKIRPMEKLKLDIQIHWETARGTRDENRRYISKENGKKWYSPNCKPMEPLRLITKFYPWQQEIIDMVSKPPENDRFIYWYWDAAGNIGKTALAKYLCAKHGALYCQGSVRHVLAAAYNCRTDIYIFGIPRTPEPVEGVFKRRRGPIVSYDAIEGLKDGMFMSRFGVDATGMCLFNSPHVICFANEPPDTSEMTTQRWKIINLGAHKLGFGHL